MNKTPKLRFNEFSGDWEIKKLGDLADICTGKKDTQDKIEDGKYPFFVRSQTIERINSYSFDGEAILTAGDGVGVGKVFHYLNEKFDYHQRVYKLSDFKEGTNGRYIYEYFKKNFIREVTKYTAKTSVDSVRMEMITKMDIPHPSIQEQEKIASFFSLIDDKISLQGEKVEALKDYKKGMMQKIFSRELRFKDDDGRDYPEWEEKKLGELFNIKAGGDIKSENVSKEMTDKKIYPVYANALSNKGLYGYTDTFKVEGNTITVTGRGDIGYAIARNNKYYPIVRLLVLSPIEKLDTLFFENIINFTNIFIESTGVPQLTSPQLSQVNVRVPVFKEQNKIAKLLKVIDIKIEKEQDKLDSLNEYKKGLLQQMFV